MNSIVHGLKAVLALICGRRMQSADFSAQLDLDAQRLLRALEKAKDEASRQPSYTREQFRAAFITPISERPAVQPIVRQKDPALL